MLQRRLIVIGIVLVAVSLSFAQKGQPTAPQVYGEPDGLTGVDCEGIMMRLDFVAIADRDTATNHQPIIVVARLGRGERLRGLNRRRLDQVANYLNRSVPKQKLVTVEGSRVGGLGQLEFFVGGKLHSVFKVRRNSDLVKGCGAN